MKVSVIVPVYNVEKYIKKCLDSLVNQTLNGVEIIVVNDGSPDNSQKIIDEYTKKYKNVKSYIKENGGLSDARNYGIKKATGKYISFVDSDDYIRNDMLEIMYNYAIKEDLDVVVCDSINVYDNGSEILIKSNNNYSDNDVRNYIISPPMACTRLFKKTIFDKIQFKKNIYYEDLEMTPKVVNITDKIGFVSEGLYYYVQRDGSIMKQNVFNKKLLNIFDVLKSNKDLLEDKFPEEIEYMYITHLLRTASLRFLNYDNGKEYIYKIHNIMKEYFPKWKNNVYYKKSTFKLKLICILAYNKNILLLKLIKKVTNK